MLQCIHRHAALTYQCVYIYMYVTVNICHCFNVFAHITGNLLCALHTHYVLKPQMCHCTFKISIITFISVRVYITYVEYSEVLQVMRVITVNGNSARLC